jgi:hypothetical protein
VHPFATKLSGNLLLGDDTSGIDVGEAPLDRLNHIKVIEDIVKAAIVREPV